MIIRQGRGYDSMGTYYYSRVTEYTSTPRKFAKEFRIGSQLLLKNLKLI
jgi:hypothetical protein